MTSYKRKRGQCWTPSCTEKAVARILFECTTLAKSKCGIEGRFCREHLKRAWEKEHKTFVETYIERECGE
jgi:hypothetical protein